MSKHDSTIITMLPSIAEIEAESWDACANPYPEHFNPFVSHAFLNALEMAKTIGGRTGWLPQHLVRRGAAGDVVACMPLYLKSHSQGEYIFDYGWAEAYIRAGGEYYPKLQAAVAVTPVPGPRLLVKPGPGAEGHEKTLVAGAR